MQDLSPVEKFETTYVRPRPGRALIVGSRIYGDSKEDRRARYRKAVGVDMAAGDGVDLVCDLEEPLPPDLGRFQHIECMSVLEHSRRPWLLAANLQRLLKKGGTIFLTVPWVWRFHDYGGDYFRFSADGVRLLFPAVEWDRLCYASNKLKPDSYLNAIEVDGHPHLPRTEVVGFGVRS